MIKTAFKKILTATCATVVMTAAHAASFPVGYSYGEIAETGVSKVGNATVSGAIVLPAEKLARFKDADVVGIRVGLVTADGISDLCGWVRTSLDGDDLDVSDSVVPEAGWNTIPLSGGLKVDGQPLAVGFSFKQTKGVKCISVVGENNDDARWIAKNGNWERTSREGALSVELIVEGEDVPLYDMEIVSVEGCELPVKAGEAMKFDVTVRNIGFGDQTFYSIGYDIDGRPGTGYDIQTPFFEYGDTDVMTVNIPSDAVMPDELSYLTLTLSCEDGYLDNNTLRIPVGSYTRSLPRRVLVEEFTTEECANCPRAINTLKQCEEAGYGDRMTVVAHHVGYYTDFLTVEEDKQNLWFFDPAGKEGTFAPAVMLDRTAPAGKSVPVQSIGYFNDFEPLLKAAVDVPAFADIKLYIPQVTNGNTIEAIVNLEKLPILDVCAEQQRLTLYVVEDNIPMMHQAGISSSSFTHSHVFRKCITDIWGDPVRWTDNKASMQYSIEMDPAWNRSDVSVVAFLHSHDMNDATKCRVFNTATSAASGSTGVDTLSSADSGPVKEILHTTSGAPASAEAKGLLIKTTIYSDGSVRTTKVFRR